MGLNDALVELVDLGLHRVQLRNDRLKGKACVTWKPLIAAFRYGRNQLLQSFMDDCAQDVTGSVRLRLYKGTVTVTGRRSPRSLYRTDFATFEADTVYRQRDAEGFINLNALRLKIRALRDRPA